MLSFYLLTVSLASGSVLADLFDNFGVLKIVGRDDHITLCSALVVNSTTVIALSSCLGELHKSQESFSLVSSLHRIEIGSRHPKTERAHGGHSETDDFDKSGISSEYEGNSDSSHDFDR